MQYNKAPVIHGALLYGPYGLMPIKKNVLYNLNMAKMWFSCLLMMRLFYLKFSTMVEVWYPPI